MKWACAAQDGALREAHASFNAIPQAHSMFCEAVCSLVIATPSPLVRYSIMSDVDKQPDKPERSTDVSPKPMDAEAIRVLI